MVQSRGGLEGFSRLGHPRPARRGAAEGVASVTALFSPLSLEFGVPSLRERVEGGEE